MPNFIPRGDAEFNAWQTNFVTYANVNHAALGLVPADLSLIIVTHPVWTLTFTPDVAAQANAQSARATTVIQRVRNSPKEAHAAAVHSGMEHGVPVSYYRLAKRLLAFPFSLEGQTLR